MNRSITSVVQMPAELAQHHDIHLDRESLAVDEHAVAIEDHELDRPARGHRDRDAVSADDEVPGASPVTR